MPAVALLMLNGIDMEHLHVENLNLIPPHAHDLVLNRGMEGIYWLTLLLSVYLFCCLSNNNTLCWRVNCTACAESSKLKVLNRLYLRPLASPLDVGHIPGCRPKLFSNSLMIYKCYVP